MKKEHNIEEEYMTDEFDSGAEDDNGGDRSNEIIRAPQPHNLRGWLFIDEENIILSFVAR